MKNIFTFLLIALITMSVSAQDNVILNGSFDNVNANNRPEDWLFVYIGSHYSVAPDSVEVIDGVLNLYPEIADQDPDAPKNYKMEQQYINLTGVEYTLSFVAWADDKRPLSVNFQDRNNGYQMLGISYSANSVDGMSKWEFELTTTPTRYEVNVIFDNLKDNGNNSLDIQCGQSDIPLYLDDVSLVVYDPNKIKNGNFDNVEANNLPSDWDFLCVADRYTEAPDTAQVIDGVLNLYPKVSDTNPDDAFNYKIMQQNIELIDTTYSLSFVAWADEARPLRAGFQDRANGFILSGSSTSDCAVDGASRWDFELTTTPTRYVVDVVFDNLMDSPNNTLDFQCSLSDVPLYIDSVLLVIVEEIQTLDTINIEEYGQFIPDRQDSVALRTNFNTINGAIVELGKTGGGTIILPADTFYIGVFPEIAEQAITIDYNNITICGAGMDKTVLRTNGTFLPKAWHSSFSGKPTNPGGRGNGIRIYSTPYANKPRTNITLRDFELDGQAGWTGDYTVDYWNGSDEGWDMYHKGILSADGVGYVDSLTIENIRIHNYRGEILYGGGEKMGTLHIKNVQSYGTNASTCNVHASEMLIEDCQFGSDVEIDEDGDGKNDNNCRFFIEVTGREYFTENQTHKALFRNNIFRGGEISGQIVICQGDWYKYEIEFVNNDIDANGNDLFSIMGGIAGPIKIHDNVINNCGWALNGNILGGGLNEGVPKSNKDVYFENNTITNGGALIAFSGPAHQFFVRNNSFSGKVANKSQSVMWVGGDNRVNFYSDNVVEGNTFTNCMYPQKRVGWPDIDNNLTAPLERPLMDNNTYDDANMTKTEGFTIYNITSASPRVQPNYEEVEIYADADGVVADLDVFAYPDGQVITVYGGSASKRVKFATGQASYTVSEDKYLTGDNTLYFRFNKQQSKWIETTKPTAVNTSVEGKGNVVVYPNPTSGNVTVAFEQLPAENAVIRVFNHVGQLVKQKTAYSTSENINLSGQAPGIYFVNITGGGASKILKLIVR